MNTRKVSDISDEDFAEIENEQVGQRDSALGFKKIPQKKPSNYYNKDKKPSSPRMRTFHAKAKKPKLWQAYMNGEITISQLKEKM